MVLRPWSEATEAVPTAKVTLRNGPKTCEIDVDLRRLCVCVPLTFCMCVVPLTCVPQFYTSEPSGTKSPKWNTLKPSGTKLETEMQLQRIRDSFSSVDETNKEHWRQRELWDTQTLWL